MTHRKDSFHVLNDLTRCGIEWGKGGGGIDLDNEFVNSFTYWKCNFPMTPPVRPLVSRSVGQYDGWSVGLS